LSGAGAAGALRLPGGVELGRFGRYELCVQSPALEAGFLRAVHGGGGGLTLGEDFAGPAGISRAWLVADDRSKAVATDRDSVPLRYAVSRLAHESAGALERLTVRERDVMEVGDRADVIAALNFAVCELHARARLVTYLRHVVYRLNAHGVFVADLYAGADAMSVGESRQIVDTDWGEVTYVWEQRSADVCTARVVNAISFGAGESELRDAFVYEWRLWGIAELREAMREAGFRSTEVHAGYGEAIDGEGNLILAPPIGTDDEAARVGDDRPEADDPAVYLVVGRV